MRQRLAAVLVLAASTPAASAEWSFELEPYAWAPFFDATYRFNPGEPGSGSSDASLLDVLEGFLLIRGEVRRGGLAFLGEFNALKLGNTVAGRIPALETELGLEGSMTWGAAAWTMHDDAQWRIEALAGLRYWDVTLTGAFAGTPISVSRDVTWLDPIVGGRVRYVATERIDLTLRGDIGGFDAGSQWQSDVSAEFGWQISPRWKATAGYRVINVEFRDDGVVADMTLHGPFAAIGVQF